MACILLQCTSLFSEILEPGSCKALGKQRDLNMPGLKTVVPSFPQDPGINLDAEWGR